MLLALLDRYSPIHTPAAVNLHTLLVGIYIHLDTRRITGQRQNGDIRSFWGRIARSIEDKGVIVSGVIETAVVGRENIRANLFGACEIQSGAVDDADGTGWDEDIVDVNVASGVGHIKGIIKDRGSFRIDECAQVPVDVVGKHDWGRLVEWDGGEDTGPLVRRHAVCGIGDDGSGKAFERFVKKRKSNRSCVVGDYGPVSLIVSNLGGTDLSSRAILEEIKYQLFPRAGRSRRYAHFPGH